MILLAAIAGYALATREWFVAGVCIGALLMNALA